MKITAIIAHRNELPANVARTVQGLKRHGIPVDLIEDVPLPMGCGWRRHQGIMRAKTEGVFLCDAHMQFDEGYFDHLARALEANPRAVTVSRMQSIDGAWRDIQGQLYAAAQTHLKVEAPGGQYWPMAARWRHEDAGGEYQVSAVMGACYGMTQDHYIDMGQPLAVLRAWGQDEEILSAASWIRGGECRLISGLARHIYGAPKAKPTSLSKSDIVKIWANRVAVLNALPIPAEEQRDLVEWVKRTHAVQSYRDEINAEIQTRRQDISRVREALEGGIGWASYCKRWVNLPTDQAKHEERQAKMAKADKRRKKGAKTGPVPKAPEQKKAEAVTDYGIPCNHCGHRYGHKVTNTYPNGRRRRVCGACNMPFVTFQVEPLQDQ